MITFDVVEVEKDLGDNDTGVKKNNDTEQNLDRVALRLTKISLDLVVEKTTWIMWV